MDKEILQEKGDGTYSNIKPKQTIEIHQSDSSSNKKKGQTILQNPQKRIIIKQTQSYLPPALTW